MYITWQHPMKTSRYKHLQDATYASEKQFHSFFLFFFNAAMLVAFTPILNSFDVVCLFIPHVEDSSSNENNWQDME